MKKDNGVKETFDKQVETLQKKIKELKKELRTEKDRRITAESTIIQLKRIIMEGSDA